ncbi:MAG: response regulator [Verrucomicrobiota bacterium]
MKPLALVIDDEVQIRRLLRFALEAADYVVCEADKGQLGLAEAALRRPDIILLDLGLPDLDGVEVLKRLREWSETPVLVLSVRDAEDQKIAALDAGADDYVTKPFSTPELLARLRVAQRRARPAEETATFTHNGLQVDLTSRRVTVDGRGVTLTATEYALLRLLVRHAGRVITHRQMLREIWGPNSEEHRQYLRVYITHLRRKIERDPQKPVHIKTESGIGYRLIS